MGDEGRKPDYCDKCYDPIHGKYISIDVYDLDDDEMPHYEKTMAKYCRECYQNYKNPVTI